MTDTTVTPGLTPLPLFGNSAFADAEQWNMERTEGCIASLSADRCKGKNTLRLDYDFNGRSGYVIIRRRINFALPDNYALSFRMQGDSPVNRLEVKLLTEDAQSVWWWFNPSCKFAPTWEKLRLKKRHFKFGWGPDNTPLNVAGYIDLCLTATNGGAGTIWLQDMEMVELPPSKQGPISGTVRTSSGKHRVDGILGEQASESWDSDGANEQELLIKLDGDREFGGMIIDWGSERNAAAFDIAVHNSLNPGWRSIYRTSDHAGTRTWVYAPECEANEIRLRLKRSRRHNGYRIERIALQPLQFGESPNAFFASIAAADARGCWPRQTHGEMPYWTVVGAYGDTRRALINEDGVVELDKQACTIEPFIRLGESLLTWTDGEHECSLEDEHLPLPRVVRRHADVELSVRPWVSGEPGRSLLHIEYVVRNISEQEQRGDLALALRHFQVNPPWQFLNWTGGFTAIKTLDWDGKTATVNGTKRITFHAQPGGMKFGATTLDRGDIVEHLSAGKLPRRKRVKSDDGFASGAAVKQFHLAPGGEMRIVATCPVHDNFVQHGSFADSLAGARAFWRDKLGRVKVSLPGEAKDIEHTIKAQLGFILVNRKGRAIQPGSRCYDRSWARDGALTSCALLQYGFYDEVAEFISWFAPHQFENGKVPCVVDHAGGDPLPEHDSQGEFIFLIAEYLRYTDDELFVRKLMPRVLRAVDYIKRLLNENKQQEPHLRNILPPSVSHEGYFDKAAYSYWDDFWCLKGLQDARYLARRLLSPGSAEARFIESLCHLFEHNLHVSIAASMEKHGIDYVPGSADRGDFDPTSTTIGLDPAHQLSKLTKPLEYTFDRYWSEFMMRRSGHREWTSYTPYELRTVGSFVRLGQRYVAHEALKWFMSHRRPLGWRQWGEVVWRDPRTPISIGDMPHTWVGSDFLRSVRNMLAYEREDGALIVGAGILYEWLFSGDELTFELPVGNGNIRFSGKRSGYRYHIRLSGDCTAPIVLQLPFYAKGVHVDGRPGRLELPVRLPADVMLDLD